MHRDLIVFGEDWGGLPSSTQHLILRLSEKRKVVWVNSIGLRRPTFTVKDAKRALQKIRSASRQQTQSNTVEATPSHFTVINPTTLPAPRSWIGRALAANLLGAQLRPIIKQCQLKNPIVWTSLPTAIDVYPKLDASRLVYYCGDDFSQLAGVDHRTVAKREQELLAQADLVLAASETLKQQLPSKQTRLLPHGVDYHLFAEPCPRAADFPDHGKPTAGFYGSLSEWLDYDLLDQVITAMPHWQFLFIGDACARAQQLGRHVNVTLLGAKAHQLLPGYSQHWSASLLPFLNNGQIAACNPLKLREYLAAGRPVISTPFPALQDYTQHVTIVKRAEEMVDALEAAQYQPINSVQQQAVKPHTWDARATQLDQWLNDL